MILHTPQILDPDVDLELADLGHVHAFRFATWRKPEPKYEVIPSPKTTIEQERDDLRLWWRIMWSELKPSQKKRVRVSMRKLYDEMERSAS